MLLTVPMASFAQFSRGSSTKISVNRGVNIGTLSRVDMPAYRFISINFARMGVRKSPVVKALYAMAPHHAIAHEQLIVRIPTGTITPGVAPVTVSTKIGLKVHVMEILVSIDVLSAIKGMFLFPMAVLARIRVGRHTSWWGIERIRANFDRTTMTGMTLAGGRLISKVVPAIVKSSMAASGPAVMFRVYTRRVLNYGMARCAQAVIFGNRVVPVCQASTVAAPTVRLLNPIIHGIIGAVLLGHIIHERVAATPFLWTFGGPKRSCHAKNQ
jgi:hypothetical protein